MSWELVFHPDVEGEVREAYQWYEERKEGLGDEFLESLESVYAGLRATPEMHQVLEHGIRHSRLKRFPYAVYYRILVNRVEVIAVHHGSRNPDRWRSRA